MLILKTVLVPHLDAKNATCPWFLRKTPNYYTENDTCPYLPHLFVYRKVEGQVTQINTDFLATEPTGDTENFGNYVFDKERE